MNPTPSTVTSTSELGQLYSSASRSFLHRDYQSTASSLHSALQLVSTVSFNDWYNPVSHAKPIPPLIELHRRLQLLQITFVATVYSSPTPALSATSPHLDHLLTLQPANLIRALWTSLLSPAPSDDFSTDTEPDVLILPHPSAAFLHPSLPISLVFAALKLGQPASARHIAEAWFGSVSDDVDNLICEISRTAELDIEVEFPLDAVAGATKNGSAKERGMSGPSILAERGEIRGKSKAQEARKALAGGWFNLHDLLVLHVLPQLGEWDAAADFVRLQGKENGGWVPDARVEAALCRLEEIQQEQAHATATRLQRQKDLDALRAEHNRTSRSLSSSRDTRKGKARETSPVVNAGTMGSSGSSPSTSPPKRHPSTLSKRSRSKSTSPVQGPTPRHSPPLATSSPSTSTTTVSNRFNSLRSSVSSYLARPSSSSPSAPPAPSVSRQPSSPGESDSPSFPSSTPTRPMSPSPTQAILSYLRLQYTYDPVRLLSFGALLLALVTWVRRRLAWRRMRGERGLGMGLGEVVKLVGVKVGETVGMVLKVGL
ncbi:hypothetical protein JCM11641_002500 [Rhodosporidiobolus odoratus]